MEEVTSGSAAIDETANVGEQLRSTREAQGLTLEDIAAKTRIPTRHLESLERSEWGNLPAPTYTIGFAKSYAVMLGLDRVAIAAALKAEMGGRALAARPAPQVFEPADPARVMPVWVVVVALLALVAVAVAFLALRNNEIDGPDAAAATEQAELAPAAAVSTQPAAFVGAPGGPVVITANEPAWIQVAERSGQTLYQGELAAGQSYEVPATASAPVLRTGRPQSIRIAVGTADAPSVGPADTMVRDVSLVPADLMRGPAATPAAPVAPAAR